MKKLVEVHVLQNFAPSNLNRDDTGAPKDALFGGTRRARISSQCQKRAVRQMFDSGAILARNDLAVRTKLLAGEIEKELLEKGRSNIETHEKICSALASAKLKVKDDRKTEYLLFLGKREIRDLAVVIDENWDNLSAAVADSDTGEEQKGKKKKGKMNQDNPEIAKAIEKILNGGRAADVALFGRMLADMPQTNQDAACQVAHAISTHTVEREFDYYTAIDDLKPGDTSGADMIGTIDFNSACFYRYACLDVNLLERNLQGDRELAMKTVRAFLDAFIRSEPTGKQNSFAAHNPPEFILLRTAQDAAPINLANAFEAPVRTGRDKGLTQLSTEKLVEKAIRLRDLYSYSGNWLMLNVCDVKMPDNFGKDMSSWPELLDEAISIVEGW